MTNKKAGWAIQKLLQSDRAEQQKNRGKVHKKRAEALREKTPLEEGTPKTAIHHLVWFEKNEAGLVKLVERFLHDPRELRALAHLNKIAASGKWTALRLASQRIYKWRLKHGYAHPEEETLLKLIRDTKRALTKKASLLK